MSDGDKPDEEIKPDKEGKFPESVSWEQHVRAKETISNKLNKATQKIASLEEQLGKTTSAEEFSKVQQELEETKTQLQQTSDELKSNKDKSLTEKRDYLVAKGIPKEQATEMSEEALIATAKALESYKPKPDLGGGGGGGSLPNDPMELFRMAKTKTK